MHEANHNIKTSTMGEKDASLPSGYAGAIAMPYGLQLVKRGEALDHATMRSSQLSGLLRLIGGIDDPHFGTLSREQQDNLLWLTRQLASETEAMFEIVADDAVRGQQ
jgi:hypothetical protein